MLSVSLAKKLLEAKPQATTQEIREFVRANTKDNNPVTFNSTVGMTEVEYRRLGGLVKIQCASCGEPTTKGGRYGYGCSYTCAGDIYT